MKIVMPGGSGQVGRLLARHSDGRGQAVTVLSRKPGVARRARGRAYAGAVGRRFREERRLYHPRRAKRQLPVSRCQPARHP
jgi:uncharacterized protein YbjT (DUF2867 family)